MKPLCIRDYSGKVAGIDTSIYLHKYWWRCGNVDRTIKLFINQIELFAKYNVKCIYVLDGRRPIAKDTTHDLRVGESEIVEDEEEDGESESHDKEEPEESMSESESEEEIDSDKEDEEKSGQVQPFTAIVPKLKDLFIKMKVNFIVSPYESDPQLTNMFRSGMIDVVVSEDSDFIMHQCEV